MACLFDTCIPDTVLVDAGVALCATRRIGQAKSGRPADRQVPKV